MADKALLLGINSYKKVSSLRGCVNDVDNMRKLLTEVFGFNPSNVKVLLNDKVVKKDVKAQMAWLFKDAKPNDRVVEWIRSLATLSLPAIAVYELAAGIRRLPPGTVIDFCWAGQRDENVALLCCGCLGSIAKMGSSSGGK